MIRASHDRYDGSKTVGYRLYREVTTFEKKRKCIGRESSIPTCYQWETLATNLEEFRKVAVSQNFYSNMKIEPGHLVSLLEFAG